MLLRDLSITVRLFSCIADSPLAERNDLFLQKIRQCEVIFDFSCDPVSDLKWKEVKRAALNELVDYVMHNQGVLSEACYHEIIIMVRIKDVGCSSATLFGSSAPFNPGV